MNKTIFKQLDSRWSSLAYPTKKSSFGANGCGCVACTHIAIEQPAKKSWTPKKLRSWMVKQGYAVAGHGTEWKGIEATLKHIGHDKVVWIHRDDPMSKAWKELNKGDRIGVLLVDDSKTPDGTVWTSSGHYVAFTDYKYEKGVHKFYIKDSGFRNHDGWFTYEKSLKGALPQMWIVRKLPASRLVTYAEKYAWTESDDIKKYASYPKGKAKPVYTKALDEHFGKDRKWQDSAKKGASCDVYQATNIRSAKLGSAPRGLTRSWMDESKHFRRVKVTSKTVQDGDIISIVWSNGNPHWCIAWNGYILEASLKGWWPKKTNTLKSRLSSSGKRSVVVYRAK
mgnify:CR=1 FL=1